MSSTPQDLPTLTDPERLALEAVNGDDTDAVQVLVTERRAILAALEELDAYRQRDREPILDPVPGIQALHRLTRRAGFPAAPEAAPAEPTWQQAADAVAGRLRILAVDIGPDVAWEDDDHLDASALRHLAAVLPMLEARSTGDIRERRLAAVVADARAVVASIERNGVTGDHMAGILEPVADAIRELETSLDNLPPAR